MYVSREYDVDQTPCLDERGVIEMGWDGMGCVWKQYKSVTIKKMRGDNAVTAGPQ
jgi:hypothetical protein